MNESEPFDEVSKIVDVIETEKYVEFLRTSRRHACGSASVVTGIQTA
jgi:hypothetical protein